MTGTFAAHVGCSSANVECRKQLFGEECWLCPIECLSQVQGYS